MTWIDVAIFSGLAFAIGCCIGNIVEIQRKGKELDDIRRLHKESGKIIQEMQDEMLAIIEKLEEQNCAQHNMIEALAERNELLEMENHRMGEMIAGETK